MDAEQPRDETEYDPSQDPTHEDAQTQGDQALENAEGQEPVKGDQGEQVAQAANAEEAGFNPDRPVRTSPPAPSEQSGVPLAEDREAGVEPGEGNAESVAASEAPEGDSNPAE